MWLVSLPQNLTPHRLCHHLSLALSLRTSRVGVAWVSEPLSMVLGLRSGLRVALSDRLILVGLIEHPVQGAIPHHTRGTKSAAILVGGIGVLSRAHAGWISVRSFACS